MCVLAAHWYVLCVGDWLHLFRIANFDLWNPQSTAQMSPVSVPRPDQGGEGERGERGERERGEKGRGGERGREGRGGERERGGEGAHCLLQNT